MFKSPVRSRSVFVFAAILSFPLIVSAQANRTWVSGAGDDMNACSRTAPCRTFAGAIPKTNVAGEINVLDPGGYGTVVIGKSITIDGTGTFGSILAAGTHGILINLTDQKKTVRLRGLSLNGLGTATDGIRVMSGGQVFIEDVVIDGIDRHGVNVAGSGAYVSVKNTTIRNCGKFGINLEPSGASANATLSIESSQVSSCEAGLFAGRGTAATVRDSAFLRNLTGVGAEGSDVALLDCLVAHGDRGLVARANAAIRISSTTVTRNQTGLAFASSGKIISFKNNIVHGNGTDGAPTHTFPPA
jgi:hypothetical protein